MFFVVSNCDLYSVSVIALMYVLSCYIGLRYNGTGLHSLLRVYCKEALHLSNNGKLQIELYCTHMDFIPFTSLDFTNKSPCLVKYNWSIAFDGMCSRHAHETTSGHHHVPYIKHISYHERKSRQAGWGVAIIHITFFPLYKYQSLISMKLLFIVICVVFWLPKINLCMVMRTTKEAWPG